MNHPPTYVRTFSQPKVFKGKLPFSGPPTPMSLRNIKMAPYYIGQICSGDFAKKCSLLRMYELYLICILLQRFFRYHDHMFNKALHEKKRRSAVHVMPYGLIFKQCFPQCFNVFFTYFVTLTIFPAVLAGISYLSKLYSIFILNEY